MMPNIPILNSLSIQVATFIVTFILALIAGPILIPMLRRLKFGQTVRDDGPRTHLVKTGTPTIGGLIFLIPIIIMTVYFAIEGEYRQLIPLAFVTIGFGIVGFLDDLIKVVKKSKNGLTPSQKMLGLLVISGLFAYYVATYTKIGTEITVPFTRGVTLDLTWAFIPFTIFFLLCITNGVNLTDGLDGLASGVTLIVAVFFTIVAMTRGEWDYIKVFSSIIAGGCLGFLAFNIHPAKVFMGDTGSLALGGAIGAIAVMMKLPLVILIVGLVYVIEELSVAIQVISFKLTRKRVFKMAPIHHHFELCGWKETKVVYVFWSSTIVLSFIGLVSLGFKFF
ncbi:MAG TPA: phospho-N-acetylmuramoyl-pentapeptide-transferase [Clostridia bacterium]|nr:phospho-N-acetylmuramoyl-pentapeptide-transferase [Clostridia bacterium]